MVLRDFLPPALRGVMVAAFLAAFMSTLGTQLNWGVSYLVNDLYRRFMVREKNRKALRRRGAAFYDSAGPDQRLRRRHSCIQSGRDGKSFWSLGVGTGAVYILRWYWWRISAWSEIRRWSWPPW